VASFRAVLFDFGGTLDADGEPAVAQFLRGYRLAGGGRSDIEFEEIFRESDRRVAENSAIRGLGFRETVALQSRLLAEHEGIDAEVIARAVEDAVLPIAARNARLLADLRERGVRTAVVSNFTGNLKLCLAELGLAPFMDAVVDSAVVGVRKPEPEIFRIALEQLGVAPEDALMVGDNPYADIRAAAALGMMTCWLALSRPAPEGCSPTFRIARLMELLPIIEASRVSRPARPTTCTR